MTDILAFAGSLLSFVVLIWKEYQARTSASAKAQQAYETSQASFQDIVSTVLTRERARLSQESQAAQGAESAVDQSLADRDKNP